MRSEPDKLSHYRGDGDFVDSKDELLLVGGDVGSGCTWISWARSSAETIAIRLSAGTPYIVTVVPFDSGTEGAHSSALVS